MLRILARLSTVAVAGGLLVVQAPMALAAPNYSNCTTLQQSYPHGIGRANARDVVRGTSRPVTTWVKDTAGYDRAVAANRDLDRDRDGVACERR
jgi:hypothetical protein